MSNDELYYDSLTDLAERVARGLLNRSQPLSDLSQVMSLLAGTDTIKGQGADAMRAYIGEVHAPLNQAIQQAIENFRMALGKYVNDYTTVDGSGGFRLVREDLEDLQHKLSSQRPDYTNLAKKLQAVSDEASDIISLGGAGSGHLLKAADKMDEMKQITEKLQENWDSYESTDPGFALVQDLIARTRDLIKNTVNVPRTYEYRTGSFRGIVPPDFLNAYQASMNYVMDAKNQKEFTKAWDSINDEYKHDQERLAAAQQREANRHDGFWEVVFGVATVALGAAAIIMTAGAATPLVVTASVAGFCSASYGASNIFEGSQIMVSGKGKAFNPLRDTLFGGNQGAYDIFGNVSMLASGSVIPVSAALNAGRTVTGAVISGTGRTLVTAGVGASTNFIVAPLATSLAKSAGLDSIWAKDVGTFVGAGTSLLAGSKVYNGMGETGGIAIKPAPADYKLPASGQKILEDSHLTIEDFNRINAKQVKTPQEIALLKGMREKVPVPTDTTEMRRVIPSSKVDGMITNPKNSNIGGFMTDKSYVKGITNIDDVVASSRLDYAGNPYAGSDNYAYIDFTSGDIGKIETPYSPQFGGTHAGEWPFTGSGFTAGENRTMVPEWTTTAKEGLQPSLGSTIHEVINGKDTVVAEWVTKDGNGYWRDLR
ncbi:hypothetical protein OfM1_20550 [Lactovum odontotermitis]